MQRKEVSNPSLPNRSVHGVGPASSIRSRTLSFPVPLGTVPSRSAGIISSGGYSDYGFALSAVPEFTKPGKATRLQGR